MEERRRPELLWEFLTDDKGAGIMEITAPPMRFKQYLIRGREKALLVDTGFGLGSLKAVVNRLTDLPLILVNTHGHPDHGGGNAEFGSPLLHPADNDLYALKCSLETRAEEASHWGIKNAKSILQPTPPTPMRLEDGTVFDLGDRMIRVIHTPGHTMGSICLFDEGSGALFTGDNANAHGVSIAESCGSTVTTYLESMKKLRSLGAKTLYTGHMPGAVEPAQIDRLIFCAEKILTGEKGEFVQTPMAKGWRVSADGAAITYTEGKL